MHSDPIMQALAEQVACYRRLAKLAAIQHEHIQHSRTEGLLEVLRGRQEVLDQLAAHEKIIAPAKARWSDYATKLSTESKARAEALLAETRALLEQITSADRNDVLVLQQRKLNLGRQIRQTSNAQQVNRVYAAAAYGSAGPRWMCRLNGMDGQATIFETPCATLAQGPDYARRVDELATIIASYNEITERLQKSHEQLTATVHCLRAELSEKNRLLERRNRLAAVGEMAAGMAHEIRNPLGGIQLYASLLAKDVADRRDSLELVRKISGGVKRMEGIVGKVLQFSRELHVQPVPVDLVEVINQAIEYAGQSFSDCGAACEMKGPPSLWATVDPLLFAQALLNLLTNAAEACGQGGKILLHYALPPVDSEAKQFYLSITDNGSGIPADVLDRIFNPFFTTKDTGTGLGLAIVHRVVEAHDGTIVARNDPDGGAKFEIRL